MIDRDTIYKEINIERNKQDRLWGGVEHDECNEPNDWISLLAKHVGRAVHWPWNTRTFRYQMLIVAAVAVAAIEWVDRDGSEHEKDKK